MRSAIRSMSAPELLELARPFLDMGSSYRSRVHMRDGLLCATNGRIHLRVESPEARAADAPDSRDGILDFEPEPAVRASGPEWVLGELAAAVEAARRRDADRLAEKRAEFERRVRKMDTVRCPHCCGALVVEDGLLYTLEEYIEDNAPDEASCTAAAWLRFPGLTPTCKIVSSALLHTALEAARRLGGDAELLVGRTYQLVLRGEDWRIVIAAMRFDTPRGADDIELAAPETDGAENAAARDNDRGAAPNHGEGGAR